MAIPTENNIAYWFCMSPSCTQMNNIGDENCKKCHAELAQGAAALSGGIDKIGDCVGKDSYGDPVWEFHEPETMDFTEARASTTYVQATRKQPANTQPSHTHYNNFAMAPITAVRADHTKWQCMARANGDFCPVNDMFEYRRDNRGRVIRKPIRTCPGCNQVRGKKTKALRSDWNQIGTLEGYTAQGEEIWVYTKPYDVDEPGPIVYKTVEEFTNGDVAYE
ncbi:uncharacterized protein BKA55DRAFT_587961 [Fusarium redolens]|uniref:RanBP2-type domain-containing protein n=1 Tax=Fusarium redolens TaxID=48865 RepID=A0A9P9R7G5_FUSRE|nr:uncharacterized protein BKA55DRAFT_587961 [Fusarium redolens]KAH7269151.1 hypothetical protein BKA55DRAFT_587961 [Fusarium redolens]